MKPLLLITALSFATIANAQSPAYLWAKSAVGTSNNLGYSCSTDANGNVFVTGGFGSPTITFGTTTLNNAGSGDMFIVKVAGVTGVEENNFENGVTVFPNPTSGNFRIMISDLRFENAEVEIYNVYGEKVYSEKITNHKSVIINLEQPNGIYFIRIISEQGTVNKKLIINK